jgi:DNA gyrase subunit A
MATNIPPHNLNELVGGICHLIEHPEATVDDLMQFIQGPDFPTGGSIYNTRDIREAYASGKGQILMRAQAEIVENKTGHFQIIVTEMTYATNKATLIMKIADLVKDGTLQGIRDLRDESDKDGVRVVVDLKKEASPQKVLNQLFQMTDLQKNFNVNMLALVDGTDPQVLTLKAILEHYIKHRERVVVRRTEYELKKAKERAHILEGLKTALDHIDAVIETIRKSPTKEEAHNNLMKKFQLSDLQSTAILEMRLQTLAGLERKKIEDELAEKIQLITKLEDLLKHRAKILGLVKSELVEVRDRFGDERKTRVVKTGIAEFRQEDLIAKQEAIVTLTEDGYVKRMNPDVYRVQKRGGKGVIGATTKEEDRIAQVLSITTHDNLMFFTDTGKVFQTKAYEIPESSRTAKGQAIVNFLQLSTTEKITALIAFNQNDAYKYLLMATQNGTIKKTKLEDFENVRRSGLIAIGLDKGDVLGWVRPTTGGDEIVLTTSEGQAVRFKETDVRPMGRNAGGVRGMKLKGSDKIVALGVMKKDGQKELELLILSQNGYGKRSAIKSYKVQKRGGSGIKTMKVTAKTGKLVGASITSLAVMESDILLTSEKGTIIRVPFKSVPLLGRVTQGVRVMKPQAGDKVAAFTLL